jgi:TatD DNase family protein
MIAILRCFRAGSDLAGSAIDLGLQISFMVSLTFNGSDDLSAMAATWPADRIMVEIGSLHLMPVKYRGMRGEPAYVTEVSKVLAKALGVAREAFFHLFDKVPPSRAAAA